MSLLPGGRHRTLAPTGVIGEADLLAIERANAALAAGAHALVEQQLEILGGHRESGWASGGESSIVASGVNVIRFDLRQWAGNVLASVDVWGFQAVAGDPTTIWIEVQRAREGVIEPIASIVGVLPLMQWTKRSVGFINASAGRRLGWTIPTSPMDVPTIRVVSAQGGDEVSGITLWFQRPRTTP